ncbi:DUF502 domain-containing protein [Pseudobdellovibrio exovorus]|uniref:Transporter n=1 Tax=Pseudobdellovibrio exovorus JSS TaxID=1184267 RepID=M4V9N8_9BACT|nr:DUF502 domain-containing protein [Pseudobdellovibrio exovorus]AGH95160.1 hypothetical protein A11Q_944 [Pseudobdellovibrio exovorus JSS]
MNKLQKIFASGLITFLPLAVTIYIVYAGVTIVENLLGNLLRTILPTQYYIPGFGFLSTLILIFLLGLLLNNFVTAGLFQRLQEKLTEVPLIKVVYSPLRDLMNLFSRKQGGNALQKVVLVKFDGGQKEILGLVTRESFQDVDKNLQIGADKIAVYIPMSYGLGGYTLLIPKSQVIPIDIPVEKAMSLALTAWIKTDSQPKS